MCIRDSRVIVDGQREETFEYATSLSETANECDVAKAANAQQLVKEGGTAVVLRGAGRVPGGQQLCAARSTSAEDSGPTAAEASRGRPEASPGLRAFLSDRVGVRLVGSLAALALHAALHDLENSGLSTGLGAAPDATRSCPRRNTTVPVATERQPNEQSWRSHRHPRPPPWRRPSRAASSRGSIP